MTLTEYLQTDKDWQETKMKKTKIETEKLLSKTEYLRLVGKEMYSEKAYQEYKTKQEKK